MNHILMRKPLKVFLIKVQTKVLILLTYKLRILSLTTILEYYLLLLHLVVRDF